MSVERMSDEQLQQWIDSLSPDVDESGYGPIGLALLELKQFRAAKEADTKVADHKLIAELRAGLTEACDWIADRSSDESLLVDRLRALIPADTVRS